MSKSVEYLIETLSQRELASLDDPDRLFAISYLRGHIDLIASSDYGDDPLARLNEAVHQAFEVDSLSADDKALITEQIRQLAESE